MSEPITIPLSGFHKSRLQSIELERLKAQHAVDIEQARHDELLSAVVGVAHDAVALAKAGWTAGISGDAIVLTPPAETKPQLVPDIGPDGVSASAAAG